MPEMKGRSLEELDEIFANRVPARKFRGYQCANVEKSANAAGRRGSVEKDESVARVEEVKG